MFIYNTNMPGFGSGFIMPRRKRGKYKKKIATVRVVAPRARISRNIPNGIMKKSMKGTLKYAGSFTALAIAVDQVFRLNSIFDPDLTNVGHQPYGRDQYSTLYNRYRVDSVSWVICAATAGVTGQIITVPSNSSTAITSGSLARETPRSAWVGMAQYQDSRLSGKISLASLNGVSKKTYESDDRFQALMGANPAEVMCLHILALNIIDTPAADSLYYNITLSYNVTFYDPIPFGQS